MTDGRRLRVLLTCDAVGGVWTYALDLARGLTAEGHAVVLAVLGPAPDWAQRAEADRIAGLSLVETGLPLDWTAASADEVRAAGASLADLAAASDADLVHLHAPALAAGTHFPVPVVATCHSCVLTWWRAVKRDEALPADLGWRADLAADGIHAVAALAAPTRAFARATADAYGLGREPVVVPNGFAPPALPPGPGTRAASLTAGRLWDEGKNVGVLDEAAALARVPVEAAGPTRGPNGSFIALPRLRLLGQLSMADMRGRLAGRPIFASPALYEPFGLSVLEAAGHGCPLVLSDIPTFRELWDGAAVFLPARDTAAWAATLDRLAGSPDERDELGRRATERSGCYGLAGTVGGTLALYRAALARPAATRSAA